MLPPAQLRQGLVQGRRNTLSSTTFKASTASLLATHQPRRGFWGWRRPTDWESHLDPAYHRFCRVRTLKTRAKQRNSIRRRNKFEWDNNIVDFFTPKHVRWASRWDAGGKNKRPPHWDDREPEKKNDGAENDGYELSHREKVWKEQMEAMRKRIESDPYEAIFGKRFEPFWGPLVPSWMREEMGLPVWKAKAVAEPVKVDKTREKELFGTSTPVTSKEREKTDVQNANNGSTANNSDSYAYASSTSWDSWTNKARRVEWDSVSGRTNKYEYDPISNRMIQTEAPKPNALESLKGDIAAALSDKHSRAQDSSKGISGSKDVTSPSKDVSMVQPTSKAVNIPVKQSTDVRKSIPIPPPLSQPSHSVPIGFFPRPTSLGPVNPTAMASDTSNSTLPASLPKKADEKNQTIESGLDTLTAEDVRANMPKLNAAMTNGDSKVDQKSTHEEQLDAMLRERDLAKSKMYAQNHVSEWDKAEMDVLLQRELENLNKKKEKLLKDERGLFHIERQKRELQKLEQRINDVVERVEKLNISAADRVAPASTETKTDVPPTIERANAFLQPSLERIQAKKQLANRSIVEDADDSAAHESTEPFLSHANNAVPKEWNKQTDILQANRVQRTKGTSVKPSGTPVTPHAIAALQKQKSQAQEEQKRLANEKSTQDAERAAKLEKANAMLEAEIKEQKFRMQAHENRYAHKLRSLRQELDTAFKQSTVHSEKHLERIRSLEEELSKREADSSGMAENKYSKKVKALREELDAAYRQSSVQSEKHMERIRALEQELGKTTKAIGGETRASLKRGGAKMVPQAEGDLATNVPEFQDAGKWYKQATAGFAKQEAERAEQKLRDAALVREVREIYERAYGTIGEEHRHVKSAVEGKKAGRNVVEVESNVDLGEALARYENERPASSSQRASEGARLVDDKTPKLIPTGLHSSTPPFKWAQPPLYKVLAYDSDSNAMSTATTTSNFSGTETPISIPQALGQLNQPARYVPYFAELQREGFQVIHGSEELLVLRKMEAQAGGGVGMEDHELFKPEVAKEEKATSLPKDKKHAVNPVDGTAKPQTGNFASPTGFVNHDPPTSSESKVSRPMTTSTEPFEDEYEGISYRHYPRVKREEFPVFTGTRRKWRGEKQEKQEHASSMDVKRLGLYTFMFLVFTASVVCAAELGWRGAKYEMHEVKRMRTREEEEMIRRMREEEERRRRVSSGGRNLFWKD